MNPNKGILIVSFGTSHPDTRKKTLDAIEESIARQYPAGIYHAWTSKMIIKKVFKETGHKIPTVTEALEQIKADGITDLVVQPTHILNGIENDIMLQEILLFKEHFSSLKIGSPLISSTTDMKQLITIITDSYAHIPLSEAIVLMGHGTSHHANPVYGALDYMFKAEGYLNVFVGTVEAYPSLDTLMEQVDRFVPERVHLVPFMMVAGEHAKNDMAGDEEDSWKSQFEQRSYPVTCHLKGLGEYEAIHDLIKAHIDEARPIV